MHRRAAVPVERRDIAVVDRYGSVAARDHHLVALAPTLEDRAGRDAAAEMNHRLVDELDMDRLIVLGEPRLEVLRKATALFGRLEIGTASCRERVGHYVYSLVAAGY